MDEEEEVQLPKAAPAPVSVPPKTSNPIRRNPNGSTYVQMLEKIREPVAEYQEARGFPRTEQYSFMNLLTALCQHTYNAALNIFTMLCNLLPLFDGFTYFIRFVLDKLIEILETVDFQEKILKSIILAGELIILFMLIFFISSILLMPLFSLAYYFLCKLLNVVFGS